LKRLMMYTICALFGLFVALVLVRYFRGPEGGYIEATDEDSYQAYLDFMEEVNNYNKGDES
jgi:hypothetical protein